MDVTMDDFRQQTFAKPRYGYCESYFVESHQDLDRRRRDEVRAREREVKKRVQVRIAEQLSAKASQEFRSEHIQQMELLETETLPDIASMDIQTEIKWYMRPYLLDFLIESHAAFGLLPETLFLAVNLLDRYCSRRVVYKKHYQLVGCAALLIAAKYGDHKERVPAVKELRSMCCGLYDDDMFLQMEWHVLLTLNWVIGHPTIDCFLQLAVEHHQFDPEVEHMASYIAEIGLFHKDFVDKRPSDMARSSLALARCILGRPQEHFSEWAGQFDSTTLMGLAQHLHRPSVILQRKYTSSHFSRVAIILDEFLLRSEEETRRQESSGQFVSEAPPTTELVPAVKQETLTPTRQPNRFVVAPLTPPDTPTEVDIAPGNRLNQTRLPIGGARPPTPPVFEVPQACARVDKYTYQDQALPYIKVEPTDYSDVCFSQVPQPNACGMLPTQQPFIKQEPLQAY